MSYNSQKTESFETLFRKLATQLTFSACPFLEARILIQLASGLDENSFFKNLNRPVSRRILRKVNSLLRKRREGWPVAYLSGKKEFWSLEFKVNRQVLIPRPETELLVEKALSLKLPDCPAILDVGTGCGNIAVALGRERPEARIKACDVSLRALRIAMENAARNRVTNVTFIKSNLLSYFLDRGEKFDLIVSNPPYVSESEWLHLERSVRDFEPRKALVAGPTGLEVIKKILIQAPACLNPGGYLLMEIGAGQVEAVLDLVKNSWKEVETVDDYSGRPRVVCLKAE